MSANSWLDALKADLTDWLLAEGAPWVRYRTLVDLLDRPEDDPEVMSAHQAMLDHPQVQGLIEALREWPGPPLKRHNDAKHLLHKLPVLADFGLRADDPGMGEVIQNVLAHQLPEGAFTITVQIALRYGGTGRPQQVWMLCDAPTILYALLSFGLGEKEGVQQAVEHLASLVRDNGWPCAASPDLGKFRGPGRKDDPCPYVNLIALKALAQAPGLRDSDACHTGAEMLLGHWERQKERKIYLFGIGTDFRRLKYPLIWYDILHFAEVLTRFPWLHDDPRLGEIMDTLIAQADEKGRFTPSSVWMAWKGWEFGQKKAPSPWITFLALRAAKRMYDSANARTTIDKSNI